MVSIPTIINGDRRSVEVDGPESAVDVIRDQLGLTGTKLVCAGGVCGACTIQLDGEPTASCLTPATALRDRSVITVEGLAHGGELHPIQRAFLAHDGLQCGYCTPGFVVDAAVFVDRWRAAYGDTEPDRRAIAEALSGHLCRCGAYAGIYRAVAAACRGEHDVDGRMPRVDGLAKVTGEAVYAADVRLDGALEAVIVRSPVASGVVGPIPAGAAPWMVELLDGDRRVRWVGQPIAAIAAPTRAEVARLAATFPLDIEVRPSVADAELAKADDAPLVFEDRKARQAAVNMSEGAGVPARWHGNRRGPTTTPFVGTLAKRRIRSARAAESSGLVDLHVETAGQIHTSFEPHATVADWTDPDRLRVWTSTQAVDHVAHQLAERFDLDPARVEVLADYIGGGFGSKLTVGPDQIAACELSRLARRPVRLVLDRREEMTATGYRPATRTDIAISVADDGDIEAMVVDAETHGGLGINGIYGGLCLLVYDRTPRLARDTDVVTNTPPGSPFRGPGGPNYAWALEQAVDQAAHQLGRDPIRLRRQWDGNGRRQALYDWAEQLDPWRRRLPAGSASGRFRRGVGVAAANWIYFVDPATEVLVSVEHGRLVATTACQDMGTGSKTVLARAVAGVFEVDPLDVVVRMGLGGMGRPHGPTSGGSRTTPSLWSTAVEAATELRDEIGPSVTIEHDGHSASAHRGGDHNIRALPVTVGGVQIGRGFSSAVHVSEVEVDTRTGKTRVLSVHGGLGIGVPHARDLATSQCEGSIIQGIGLALYEQQVFDPDTGILLTSNLEDYRIPQLGDTPEITIHFHEPGWEHVPGGGVGVGEVATISPAASVGNAIFNATGWRPTIAPVRPDRVLEGLR